MTNLKELADGRHEDRSVAAEALEEIERLRAEAADLQATFDATWAAQQRAIVAWQEAHDEPEVWPDAAKLVGWLLEERARLRSALLGHVQREGQDCDKADAWDGAVASFEKGRRAGLEEAAAECEVLVSEFGGPTAISRACKTGAKRCAAAIRAKLEKPND